MACVVATLAWAEPIFVINRFEGYLAGAAAAYWTIRQIPVCWEHTDQDYSRQRAIVQRTVKETWEAAAGVTFTEWKDCTSSTQPGVHVLFTEAAPRVLFLGKALNGQKNGVWLNPTFQYYASSACKASAAAFLSGQSDEFSCLKYIAAHEWGHVLGFVHEDERADSPKQCLGESVGIIPGVTPITASDTDSIMYYCTVQWTGDGKLSDLDKKGAATIYPRT